MKCDPSRCYVAGILVGPLIVLALFLSLPAQCLQIRSNRNIIINSCDIKKVTNPEDAGKGAASLSVPLWHSPSLSYIGQILPSTFGSVTRWHTGTLSARQLSTPLCRSQNGIQSHRRYYLHGKIKDGSSSEEPPGYSGMDEYSAYSGSIGNLFGSRELTKDKAAYKDGAMNTEEGELTEEAKPGEITEEDIMKMKIALSQQATLGVDFVKVIETLQTSPYSTVSPTTIAYNATLSAAERNSNAALTLAVVEDMKKKGNLMDAVSYKLSISTCAKCGYTDEALELYDEMLQKGHCADHGVMRALMAPLAREGRGLECSRIFDDMKKLDKVAKAGKTFVQQGDYMKLIEACSKAGMYHEGMMAYKEMKALEDYKVTPTVITDVLSICYGAGMWQEAMELYASLLKECTPLSSYQYKLLMSIMLIARKHQELEYIYNNTERESVKMDRMSYQLVLESWAKTGQFKKSLSLIEKMENGNHLHGTYEPFIAAAESCRQSGEWKLALKLLRMSTEHNASPSVDMYNTVLSVFAAAEEWDGIISLFKEIEETCKSSRGGKMPSYINGDTLAYAVMAYFYTGDKSQVDRLLSLPIVDTVLLLKLRNSINAQKVVNEKGGVTSTQ